jgi:hypothetical protein
MDLAAEDSPPPTPPPPPVLAPARKKWEIKFGSDRNDPGWWHDSVTVCAGD